MSELAVLKQAFGVLTKQFPTLSPEKQRVILESFESLAENSEQRELSDFWAKLHSIFKSMTEVVK